jgi:hypothetical protein
MPASPAPKEKDVWGVTAVDPLLELYWSSARIGIPSKYTMARFSSIIRTFLAWIPKLGSICRTKDLLRLTSFILDHLAPKKENE